MKLAGSAAPGAQAIVDSGGLAAVVAAMGHHTADAEVQRWGCGALLNLANGDAACKQAIVDAGGVAAVVAAMGHHTADAALQRWGCTALWNLANGDMACKHAVMGAGGIDALVRAGRTFPTVHASVSEALRLLLGDLGGFGPTPILPLAPPPALAQPPAAPPFDVAALAEAQRAKQRAEQRAEQEAEQREEAEQERQEALAAYQQSTDARQKLDDEAQALRRKLLQSRQEAKAVQRELDALHAAAINQAVHAKDTATQQQLSASAAPLVHWTSNYQTTRPCPSFVTMWSADRPADKGRFSFEVGLLLKLWSEGGLGRRPGPTDIQLPSGDTLTRIEAVILPAQDRQAFYTWVDQKEGQRHTGQPCFNPQYPNGDSTGEKAAVLERLKARFLPNDCLEKQNFLLAFHGCSHENADSICKHGFAVVPYRDQPWFGKGLYCTTCAAARCTCLTPLPCLTS